MFNVEKIRSDFKMLRGLKMQGKSLIYFDNAATSLKPDCVIDAMNDYYYNYNANCHRGDYDIAHRVDVEVLKSRKIVAKFINCHEDEVIFTSGATMSLNEIAYSLEEVLNENDEILISYSEHASNVLPWFKIAKRKKAIIKYIPLDSSGKITELALKNTISNKTKIVSLAHVSNVIGQEIDVKSLAKITHEYNAFFVCDGAQSVPHMKIDVKDLDVDFLAFSGHKLCGPTGIGVLYGKKELLERFQPMLLGGGMNSEFDINNQVGYLNPPEKFEGGTPNIAGIIGLSKAIEYLMNIGMDNIEEYEKELKKYAISKLKELDNVILYNENSDSGIITFNIKGVFSQDAGSFFNHKGIALRTGLHCAKILPHYLHTDSTIRASLYFYNTKEEIDVFVEACKKGGDFLDAFFD